MLAIFGLGITYWSRWPPWTKVFVGYLTAVTYLGLILTGSRAGYVSAVVSILLFAVLSFLSLRAGGTGLLLRVRGTGLLFSWRDYLRSDYLFNKTPLFPSEC